MSLEMLHRGEYLAKCIENLGHGGNLPVAVPVLAEDMYEKGTHFGLQGLGPHANLTAIKV
jgi:hypothetical protein